MRIKRHRADGLACDHWAAHLLWLLIFLLVPFTPAVADEQTKRPTIALIIDDMGNRLADGQQAVALPGALTYAFLPHTPYAGRLANLAHAEQKEVMLHLPMEASRGNRLGPGGLELHMSEQQFRAALLESIQSVPHVVGLNNHMGSLLTQHPGAMKWLMEGMREFGDLYFVDSRTSVMTVAEQVATEQGLPTLSRDIFLDHVRETEAIRAQFKRLIHIATRHGKAVGIAHPYPETLAVLEEELAALDDYGVELVPVSQLTHPRPESPTLLAEPIRPKEPLMDLPEQQAEEKEADL